MSSMKKVQDYLTDLGIPVKTVDEENSLFVVNDEERGFSNLFIDVEEPILVVEQVLGTLKNKNVESLEYLMEANKEVVHGAFCSKDGVVSFKDTLALENLDQNELESTLNAVSLAMAEHASKLVEILK